MKTGKQFLAGLICLVLMAGCTSASATTYTLKSDKVPAISAVAKPKLSKEEVAEEDGAIAKKFIYQSETVAEDLGAYFALLVESGFLPTVDYSLANMPAAAQFAMVSPTEKTMVIIVDVDYSAQGYTIVVTRGPGELTPFS